jgi:phosphoribosylanthranilate isomerase
MKIKVCGLRDLLNIEELLKLKPDFIGFIFYPKSKRYVGAQIPHDIQIIIPSSVQKVGVFVDEPFDTLVEKTSSNALDLVQLHGKELPDYCEKLKKLNIRIIKAFGISAGFNFETVKDFEPYCDYYLFDTAADIHGGTGIKFEWKKLDQYTGNKPFFLSGGIQSGDAGEIRSLVHNQLHAIDINSRFELEPGLKDIPKLKSFIKQIRE